MAFAMLVGLQVTDDAVYQAYREAMTPILDRFGGAFGYDFRVSEVLRSPTPEPINRVFTIRFPDEEAKESFFADEDYMVVKQQFFERSVGATTMIAAYAT